MRFSDAARLAALAPFLLVGCAGGGGGGGNQTPLANAGSDGTTLVRQLVTLDGSGSSDPDGQALSYAWSFVSRPAGSAAALRDATTVRPAFAADRAGDYVVQLVVSDGRATSAADTVQIGTLDSAPAANAGVDQRGIVGQAVDLDGGGSSDWEGDALGYAWSIASRPATSTAQIVGPTDARPSLTPDVAGEYVVELVVADGAHSSVPDRMTFSAAAPDALPELSIDDVSVPESDAGDAGSTTATFTITLSRPSATATTVRWATADADATSPGDYVAASGTARIEAGDTSTDVMVTVNGDAVAEADESLVVTLSDAVGATIADGEGVAEIVDDDPGPPTSLELIAEALALGAIDEETALVYRVFAEQGDASLPVAYRGRDVPFFEAAATMYAARRFDTLTPATQVILAPFIEVPERSALTLAAAALAPVLQGAPSSLLPAGDFAELELVPGQVWIYWTANSPSASALAQAAATLQAEFDARIWPKLTALLGGPPAGSLIEIFLADGPGLSKEEVKKGSQCRHMLITLHRYFGWALAHELTHALIDLNFSEAACENTETLWMNEATAHWAQQHVYHPPKGNPGQEQKAAEFLLGKPERTLSDYDGTQLGHEYGAYLWFFRLAGSGNDGRIARATWDSAASGSQDSFGSLTSLEAIETTLRESGLGGFEEQWPQFALDNWNREAPYRKYYEWDKLNAKAKEQRLTASLDGAGYRSVSLDYDLPILSANYQRWSFTDPGLRTVLVTNPHAENDPTASVWAIVKIKGQPWREAEDWTHDKEKILCRDKADEDVEEIVFVITNRGFHGSDPKIGSGTKVGLVLSALPCDDYNGTTTFRRDENGGGGEAVTVANGTGLRFRVHPDNPGVWRAVEGMVNVSFDSTMPFEDGTCTGSAATSFTAAGHAQFFLFPFADALAYLGTNLAFVPTPPTIHQTLTCTSSSGTFTVSQDVPYFGTEWFFTGSDPITFDPAAGTIAGSYSLLSGMASDTWNWSFQKEEGTAGLSSDGAGHGK